MVTAVGRVGDGDSCGEGAVTAMQGVGGSDSRAGGGGQ